MTITQNDLAIVKTQRMTQASDGGGLPTANVIRDGVSNELIPDVSDIAALNGFVYLSKIGLAVKTQTSELLQAVRLVITDVPANDNMSVFMFESTSFADTRIDAQDKIESYRIAGSQLSGHLLETQLKDQKTIQMSLDQPESASPDYVPDYVPQPNDVLNLIQNEGTANEFYQYVRVQSVTTAVRVFEYIKNGGLTRKTRKIATITLAQPLRYDFNGMTVKEYQDGSVAGAAIVRETRISDATKYYSAARLTAAATATDTQLQVGSIFTSVVPASTVETQISGSPFADITGTVRAEAKTTRATSTDSHTLTDVINAGSLHVSVEALGSVIEMTDDGAGHLISAGGEQYGAIDYASKTVQLSLPFVLDADSHIIYTYGTDNTTQSRDLWFRTSAKPIKDGSIGFNVDNTPLIIEVSQNGQMAMYNSSSSHSAIFYVDCNYSKGVMQLSNISHDNPNYPYSIVTNIKTLSYTATAISYTPVDSEIIGINADRLPIDGKVQYVRAGDNACITEQLTMTLNSAAPNDSHVMPSQRLADLYIVDSKGVRVDSNLLNIDLDAGKFSFGSSFSAANYTAPYTVKYRIMDLAKVAAVDVSGRITLSNALLHDYTTAAVFSSMLLLGDSQARVTNVFTQLSWQGKWQDTLDGERADAQLNTTNYPIVTTNEAAITERWRLEFTGSTSFKIIGEGLGEIASGNINSGTSPLNPVNGKPYFTMPPEAFSSGFDAGNNVRFNTIAATKTAWIGNAVTPHQINPQDTYDYTLGYHANVDRVRGE